MHKFFLRGLAEGLTGRSVVMANSPDDVFARLPALGAVREKLSINGNTISGFCACDG